MPSERERFVVVQQLGRTYRAMMAAFDAQVGHALPRWRILLMLHEHGQCSQKQMVEHLRVDPAALTRQIKAIEALGWISRASDAQDNRLTNVRLTPEGEAVVAEAMPRRSAFFSQALDGLSAQDMHALADMLGMLEARFRHSAPSRR